MATYDVRATQKKIKQIDYNQDVRSLNKRMESVETALNLILKKLEENDQGKVEQEKQLELPNFKYPTL